MNLNILTATLLTTVLVTGCAQAESAKTSLLEVSCNQSECAQHFIKKRPIKVNGLVPRVPQYEITAWTSVHSANDPDFDVFRNNMDATFSQTGWIRVPTTGHAGIRSRAKGAALVCTVNYTSTVCWSRRLSTSTSSTDRYHHHLVNAFEQLHDMLVDDEEEP